MGDKIMADKKQPFPAPGTYHEEQIIGGPKGHMVKVMNADYMKPIWFAKGIQPGNFPSDTNPNPNDPTANLMGRVANDIPVRNIRGGGLNSGGGSKGGGDEIAPNGYNFSAADRDAAWTRKVISDQYNTNAGQGASGINATMLSLKAKENEDIRTGLGMRMAAKNAAELSGFSDEKEVAAAFPGDKNKIIMFRTLRNNPDGVNDKNYNLFLYGRDHAKLYGIGGMEDNESAPKVPPKNEPTTTGNTIDLEALRKKWSGIGVK